MEEILAIARAHHLFVMEDAAHAIGAQYHGRMIGNIGGATVFSFYATKNMTTAKGGMITCADQQLAEKLQMLTLHGISRDAWKRYSAEGSWYYEVQYLGFKYNLTDIAAALGLLQLRKLDQANARRREIAAAYDAAFAGLPEIDTLRTRGDVTKVDHLYIIKLVPDRLTVERAEFIEALRGMGIGTSVHFIPLHFHPYYRDKYGYLPGTFPVAEEVYRRSISLPLYPRMSDEDVERVITAVNALLAQYRKRVYPCVSSTFPSASAA